MRQKRSFEGNLRLSPFSELDVADSAEAESGQEAQTSQSQGVEINAAYDLELFIKSQSFIVVKSQSQKVGRRCHNLHHQRTNYLRDSLPVFELDIEFLADSLSENGWQRESRGHCDDVPEEEQTERGGRERLHLLMRV